MTPEERDRDLAKCRAVAEWCIELATMHEAAKKLEPRFVVPWWGYWLDYSTDPFVELWVRVDAGEATVRADVLPGIEERVGATEGSPIHHELIERAATWLRRRGAEPTLQGRRYPGRGHVSDLRSVDGRYLVEAGGTKSCKALCALAAGRTWCHAPYSREPQIIVFEPTADWGRLPTQDVDRRWIELRSRTRSAVIGDMLRSDQVARRAWIWRERGMPDQLPEELLR